MTLIERYRFDHGGVQRFDVFIPSQLLRTFAVVSLSQLSEEERRTGEGYALSVNLGDMAHLMVKLDSKKHITKIEIPLQEVLVTQTESSSKVLAPPYSAGETRGHPDVIDQPIAITVSGGTITGALSLPSRCQGPVPAVILVSGSGIQSKDGPFGLYRQIAFRLAERGFAVLRLDDNGAGETTIASEDLFSAEVVAVRAAIDYLRSRSDVASDKIVLLGHSAGGIIAGHIGAHDRHVQALVLLAMPAIPLIELLHEQVNMIEDNEVRKLAQHQITSITNSIDGKGEASTTGDQAIRVSELRRYLYQNPQKALSMVAVPVLIVQGDSDKNVPKAHAEILQEVLRHGHSQNSLRVFQGVNHLFFRSQESSHEVDPGVMSFVGDWIHSSLVIDECHKEINHGK